MLPQIIRSMNLHVDGEGFAAVVEEVTPPKLSLKTEEFRAGGWDAPMELEVGMEKLECGFTVVNYSPALLKHYGLADGRSLSVTLRGILKEDGKTKNVVIALSGTWKELDFGTWKSGEKAQLKVSMALSKYELKIDGEEHIHIDVLNMIRRIAGVDALTEDRKGLGL